jgi:phenylacetic acid degradation operon negative regulatory protein
MDMPSNSAEAVLDALIARLHGRGRLRVWSLVVTVFGDAVVPRGGRVALGVLQEVVGRIGVEPGTLRTALSRLASDRWVVREKEGRNSFYRLAEESRHAFDLAARRIYAAGPPAWDGQWTVAVAPSAPAAEVRAALGEAGFLRVEGRVYLRPEAAGAPPVENTLAGMLVIHGSSAEHPEALRSLWPLEETAAAYRSFADAFRPLAAALEAGGALSPLAALAARTLLVHDWRRIVLRDPGLPLALLPADWPGEAARSLVRRAYARLLVPSEAWLSQAGLPALQEPDRFRARFGFDPRQ